MTGSSNSGVTFLNAASRRMPALFTTTSIRPYVSIALCTIASPPPGVATESPLATASPPAPRISSTTRSAAVAELPVPSTAPPRSLTTTSAPRACELERMAASEATTGAGDDGDLTVEGERFHGAETTHPVPEFGFPPTPCTDPAVTTVSFRLSENDPGAPGRGGGTVAKKTATKTAAQEADEGGARRRRRRA